MTVDRWAAARRLARTLCAFGLCVLCNGRPVAAASGPRAVEGVLDLRDWRATSGGPARLDGDWRFVPNELLEPEAMASRRTGREAAPRFAPLPGTWDPAVVRAAGEPAGHGAATYALTVLLPPDPGPLALRVIPASTALRLFAAGAPIAAQGSVALERRAAEPAYRPQIVPLAPSADGRLELVLQVSNFDYHKGGPWEPIFLGAPATLAAEREKLLALAVFLAGAFILIGVYHVALWGARPRDRSPLVFAAICFAMAARGLTVDEIYLVDLLPRLSWANLVRVEYGSLLVMIAAAAAFLRALFPAEAPAVLTRSFAAASLATLAAVIVLPPAWFSRGLPFIQLLGVGGATVGTVLLARALVRRREGAALFIVGTAAIALTGAHDTLLSIYRTLPTAGWFGSTIYLQPFGLLVFILSQASVLAIRSSRAYSELEATSSELRAAHVGLDRHARELEQRVAERTAELEGANRQLAHLAEIDGLTQLANRRHFDESLRRAWHDHARRGSSLSLLLVDVDLFKPYNDHYGHLAGDDTLRRVAAVLKGAARRPGDFVARYGGEELAAILPNTGGEGAQHVAEEVRGAVEAAAIPHRASPAAPVVTASVGVATVVPSLELDPAKLVELADAALYRAKAGGRNRVEASG